MDVYRSSTFEHLEIVETGRRRRWSEDEKLRIVTKSLSAPRLVSATARRHGISRSQLGKWRRAFRAERLIPSMEPAFMPAVIAPRPVSVADDRDAAIVVELPGGGGAEGAAMIPSRARVWIAMGHTDMRRGMQGLSLQIQEGLKRDPNGAISSSFAAASDRW